MCGSLPLLDADLILMGVGIIQHVVCEMDAANFGGEGNKAEVRRYLHKYLKVHIELLFLLWVDYLRRKRKKILGNEHTGSRAVEIDR
jgi:hypothetical protein